MNSQDKALPALLELGNPAERLARSELIHRAMKTAITLLEADAVAFLMTPNPRRERLLLHAGSTSPAMFPLPPEGSDALRLLAEVGQPLLVADLSEEGRITTDGSPGVEAGPVMFTPLSRRNVVHGYIASYRRRGRMKFTMSDTRQMLLVAAWLNSALEHRRLSKTAEKFAVMDELTDVYNHRFLKAALHREIRRASRFGQALSIVVIDVDRPDENGAPPSDPVLKELASVLASQVRTFDILARFREDKFVVTLPQTSRAGATEAADRIRAAVEKHAFTPSAPGAVTVSLGVASFPQDAAGLKDLLAVADRALSEARRRDGNALTTPEKQARSVERFSPELPRIREWTRSA